MGEVPLYGYGYVFTGTVDNGPFENGPLTTVRSDTDPFWTDYLGQVSDREPHSQDDSLNTFGYSLL